MSVLSAELPPPGSELAGRWASRIAIFSVLLIVCSAVLHRFTPLSTPIALNLFKVAFAGALLAVVTGLLALLIVWRAGGGGIAPALFAMVLGFAIFAWPAVYIPALMSLPEINDVTTDLQTPPPFVTLAKERASGMNSAAYPGEVFARKQAAAYPDLSAFLVDRSSTEAYELALDTIYRLKMTVVREVPPDRRTSQPGYIEAEDRTLVLGFYDDVVLRIDGDDRRGRIDIRSASRYGRHDLGRNAARTRKILRELQARLELTVAGSAGEALRLRQRTQRTAVPRRDKSGSPGSAAGRSARDRARPDARRGQAPKAPPP